MSRTTARLSAILCIICYFAETPRWTSDAVCLAQGPNRSIPGPLPNGSDQHPVYHLGDGHSALSFNYQVPLTAEKNRVECVQRLVISNKDFIHYDYIINFELRAESWKQSASYSELQQDRRLEVLYEDPDTGSQKLIRPMSSIVGKYSKAILWSALVRPTPEFFGDEQVRQTVWITLPVGNLSVASIQVNSCLSVCSFLPPHLFSRFR